MPAEAPDGEQQETGGFPCSGHKNGRFSKV